MSSTSAKRVSYILTTRNRAAFLERTIQNARQFITDRDELVILDGGSTDDTPGVIERNRDIIGCFVSEKDHGEAHAVNKGILLARGEYIKFLTDDDFTFAPCMAGVVRALEGDPRIDALLCGGEHYHLEPDGTLKLDFYFRLTGERAAAVGRPVSETGDTAGSGLGLIVRRRIIPLVGLFDTRFVCVDTEFLARLKRPQVALRYYDGKLYRHIDYPHSGVMNRQRAARDAARTFITSGAWPTAMGYGPDAIADALALTSRSGGNQMARVLRNIECLRQSGYGSMLMHLSAWVSAVVVNPIRLARRIKRIGRKHSTAAIELGWPKAEPDWLHKVL